jgi:hypothetical protein
MEIRVYQDLAGGWRWRVVADNGRIVADSAEAYDSKSNAKRAAQRLIAADLTLIDMSVLDKLPAG